MKGKKKKIITRQKALIMGAQMLSAVFNPLYLPIVGLMALFAFSYLTLLPLLYKLQVLILVYWFTVLMPMAIIRLYRHYQGWNLIELGHREKRAVPYVISIACYFLCTYLMEQLHIPHFMRSILVSALAIQIACALINSWWKISTHTAAIGGVAGALFAFGEIFMFNPVGWLSLTILVAGALGTSRMILRQHSLSQVLGGFAVGLVIAPCCILLLP